MTAMRKIVQIDEDKCDGCGLCVPSCHEGAIRIIDGKARLVADNLCDGLGDCLGECPQDAITIIERDADAFDPEAVERHREKKDGAASPADSAKGGCPGSRMREFPKPTAAAAAGGYPGSKMRLMSPAASGETPRRDAGSSQLGHWPIKLDLVHPNAPYLQGADLILTADCAPAAIPSFNERFLSGKAIALACPKLGNGDLFLERLTEILRESKPRRITVIHMEVPCCSGLIMIARQALEASGARTALETIRVGLDGEVHERLTLAS
jgi:NAD-dependent dihydropyrimidine dehydrogenase PreA subunit